MTRYTIALVMVATTALAQPKAVCWNAAPLANCKGWVVTETALEVPFIGPRADGTLSTRVAFTGGWMKNTSRDRAIGVTMGVTSSDDPWRVEARYRTWKPQHAFDLSGGFVGTRILVANGGHAHALRGLTGSFGVSRKYIGLDTRVELLRAGNGRLTPGGYVSVRAGGKSGPIVAVSGLALAYALLCLAMCGETT